MACLARNAAICEKCCYWLARSRSWLEMAARACPGAADGSKWPLEPAPEPQMARNGRSSRPRSRRILEKCRSSLLRSRRMLGGCRSSLPRRRRRLDGCRSSHPGGAEGSTGAARACPGAAACSKSAARATAVRCVRFLRSKWPLENCCLMFVFYRYQLLLSSTLLRACYARVHTSIYIYIYRPARGHQAVRVLSHHVILKSSNSLLPFAV